LQRIRRLKSAKASLSFLIGADTRTNLPAADDNVHPVQSGLFYWINLKGANPLELPSVQNGRRGRDYFCASGYHAVLAVKDERGRRSPPAAVFDP